MSLAGENTARELPRVARGDEVAKGLTRCPSWDEGRRMAAKGKAEMRKFKVEYDSNNSGGGWWLSDADWQALEDAGWQVDWVRDRPAGMVFQPDPSGRWLGALATSASIIIHAISASRAEKIAMARWSKVLPKQDVNDMGCSCCGQPHNFYASEVK